MRDQQSPRILRPSVEMFCILHAILVVAHGLVLEGRARAVMVTLAASALAIGVLLRWRLRGRWVQGHAAAIPGAMVVVIGVNSLVHVGVTQEIHHTTNVVFVVALAGYFVASLRALVSLIGAMVVGWVAINHWAGWPDLSFHYGFTLLLGTLVAVLLRRLRWSMERHVDAVRKSRDLIDTVFDRIPGALLLRGPDGRIIRANDQAESILGIAVPELIGMSPDDPRWQIFDAEGRPLNVDSLPMILAARDNRELSNRLVGIRNALTGEMAWALGNVFPIDDPEGRVMTVSAFVDVTERIRTERLLQKSEDLSRAVLDSMQDALIVLDEERSVTRCNPAAEALTGRSMADLSGRPISSVLAFRPEQGVSAVGNGFITDGRGRELFVLWSEFDLATDHPEGGGSVVVVRDVQGLLESEQERFAVDKMLSIGELAGGIAHDFNNLLVGLYGSLSLAERSTSEAPVRKLISEAGRSLQQATALTKQLLTFAVGSDPILKPLDLAALVQEVCSFALSGSGVEMVVDAAEDLGPVQGDRGQLYQVFSNLALNSRQAMADSGRISVALSNCDDEWVQVILRDTGPGIPEEHLAQIFDPYFTTKDYGNGLGLASVRSIVEKHGGSVAVDGGGHKAQAGATFTLLLRRAQSLDNLEVLPMACRSASGPLLVLVMDDDDVVREMTRSMLEYLGHAVCTVGDGQAAVEAYGRSLGEGPNFDCAILDLTVVGGVGGAEAARSIRNLDDTARLVVASGYSDGMEMASYREHGFCGVLEKPYTITDLESLFSEIFGVQGARSVSAVREGVGDHDDA